MVREQARLMSVLACVAMAAAGWQSAQEPALTAAAVVAGSLAGSQSSTQGDWSPKQIFMAKEAADFRLFLIREAARDSKTKDADPFAKCEKALSAVSQAEVIVIVRARVLEARNCLCGGGGAFGDKPNDVITDLIAAGSSHEWNHNAFDMWRTGLRDFAERTGRHGLQDVVAKRKWPTPEHGPVEWVRSILEESFNAVSAPPEPTSAIPKEQ
jgi:hypothetical protein